jgi:serine/threonine-protein kinase
MLKESSKVKACLRDFVAELPPGREVMFLITIANSGKVSASQISQPTPAPKGLERCLKGVMRSARFPLNSNNPEFSIEIPIKLK